MNPLSLEDYLKPSLEDCLKLNVTCIITYYKLIVTLNVDSIHCKITCRMIVTGKGALKLIESNII